MTVEYKYSRLCFKADFIEPLNENDSFIVITPEGKFKFTKAEFYRVFPNVVKSMSYQKGKYHYPQPPKQALDFFTPNEF